MPLHSKYFMIELNKGLEVFLRILLLQLLDPFLPAQLYQPLLLKHFQQEFVIVFPLVPFTDRKCSFELLTVGPDVWYVSCFNVFLDTNPVAVVHSQSFFEKLFFFFCPVTLIENLRWVLVLAWHVFHIFKTCLGIVIFKFIIIWIYIITYCKLL